MNDSNKSPISFTIVRQDWSNHRQGERDQAKHDRKVRKAIKDNLSDIVSQQDIITSDGTKKVRIPIRGVKEYQFRHGNPPQDGSGNGYGPPQPGSGQPGPPQPGSGQGPGGDQPGEEYYETDITIEELQLMVMEDLSLPNLQPKPQQDLMVDDIKFTDVRRRGPMSRLHKKRTMKEILGRNAAQGRPVIADIQRDDLRFRTWREHSKPQSGAVIIAMMDVSASMGEFEKYIARSFFFWMKTFLRSKYSSVEIVFISHHTEAKEVTEEEFFSRGESGGTMVSSAYQLALETIDQRYPADRWNIYPFHISDGDNYDIDDQKCIGLIGQLLERSNLVGYGQVDRRNREAGLLKAFSQIDHPQFITVKIQGKEEVYPALLRFFGEPENDLVQSGD